MKGNCNRKEPIPCYHCMMPACAENGDHNWYCFRCFIQLFSDDIDEYDADESLKVCNYQLNLQSARYHDDY